MVFQGRRPAAGLAVTRVLVLEPPFRLDLAGLINRGRVSLLMRMVRWETGADGLSYLHVYHVLYIHMER